MRIAILDASTVSDNDIDFGVFDAFGEVTIYQKTLQDEVIQHIGDSDCVLLNKVQLTADILKRCPSLKIVCLFATGYNNVDLQAARERGITVCNAPDYSTDAVAQHTFALILHFYSRVPVYESSVRKGDWMACGNFSYFLQPQRELAGKTIGLVGFGSIARQVAKVALAFGMRVVVHTRTVPQEWGGVFFVPFSDLLSQSDIVSLHCPLTEATRGLIGADALARMKQGALLINTARGPIVDEKALAQALSSRRLLGAGLDVLDAEPMRKDCPLRGLENCVITPHVAWAPQETRRRLIDVICRNLEAYCAGIPQNVVNP